MRLIILTRNFRLIPELFMKVYGNRLQALSGNKLDLNRVVIVGTENVRGAGLYRRSDKPLLLANIIDSSADKVRFIRKKNAFFIGDREEYKALVRNKYLQNLRFYEV